MNKKKRALLSSVISLVLCFSMLLSTTYAWFTDSVTSTNNIIQSGNLDVELEYWDSDAKKWKDVKQETPLFEESTLWEPGHTQVVYLRVANEGTLALKYQLGINIVGESTGTNVKGDPFKLSDSIYMGVKEDLNGETDAYATREDAVKAVEGKSGIISTGYSKSGDMAATADKKYLALVVYMPTTVENEANYKTGTEAPKITLGIKLVATQKDAELDSFGSDYDAGAELPKIEFLGGTATAAVTATAENKVASDVKLQDKQISGTVPAGALLEQGVTEVTLNVTLMEQTTSNVATGKDESMVSVDVHVAGLSKDNKEPVVVTMQGVLVTGLNEGNLDLYHVEQSGTNKMTQKFTAAEVKNHNDFYYDPATGDVTVAMATFSEVAMRSEEAMWEGKFDYSWYTNAVALADSEAVTEYVIANADQLAGFGAIVGGMNGKTQDSFSGKTVKLTADINLGYGVENHTYTIFYPIGYYNSEGTYERTNTAITSGLRNFEGTFDGNGHTISNFYQNTWEMKGDHNWYSPEEQYYRDGMGLFGRVYGGTVKNLTVKNFSSDGEIATTGVIAAYADFGATFENITVFNCNPRVYNIGNGGIVGCVGWYTKGETTDKVTFKNITVDNSNKISALWGSYDVACGGIVGQYYPTSGQSSADYPENAGIHFENCHVSAQMDVYNDVCANYQYYAYRYTGMLIGSIRENETVNGHVYPKMDDITASGCTVHFGDWNDYYYCELVANSKASYTHDHQMSRLEQVASVDVANKKVTSLEGETTDIPTSGRVNYVVVKAKDANGMWIHGDGHDYAECYHFVNGVQHKHDVADSDNPNPTETVNGVEGVLKEDKQLVYREFNQLFTGYGWGVTSKGVGDLAGVTILDREEGNSVKKFEGKVTELANNTAVKLGDIFKFVDNGVELVPGALTVTVTNLDENNPVSAELTRDTQNWENGTIEFAGTGKVQITIQDYYFCTPTTIEVTITERQNAEKFETKFTGDFLYRVGNQNTVKLDSLFKAKDGADIGTVDVTVDNVAGNASGAYTSNATWTNGTIQFSGTGVVKVTIKDDDKYCTPTVLYLEVVEATNVTGLSGTIAGNVVLLNNCGLSSLTVSGRNTVYGNGFTATYTGNGQYLNNGLKQGVITVSENGTLDNLRVVATIYPASYLYFEEAKNGPSSVEGDKTRYHYQLSAVTASGNATISNCYIYGGRNNIFVNTGDVTIKDTILECGTLSNVQIQSNSSHTVTLENVTTIQHQVNATIVDTAAVMMGAGVVVGPDTDTNPTIVLNGSFRQYNWVTAADKDAITNSTAKTIIQTALDATAFNHMVNGVTASNLGIIFMNEAKTTVENNTGLPYKAAPVSMLNQNGQVYSLQEATESQIYSDYANADRTTVNGDYMPTFGFDLGDQEISYDGSEDTRYLYGDANGVTALYQDGDTALALDLSKLATVYKYTGLNYTYTAVCKDSSGNALTATNGVVALSAQGNYTLVFTIIDNIFYDKDGKQIDKSVTRTYEVPLELTVKEASIKNAEVNITKTALDGVYTTVNITDYKLRINFLDCISVTDYDNTGRGTTVVLSSNIASATLTPASVNVFTTAFTATITYTDGRVLTVNFSKISGSSAGTKTATLNTSGGVYFITDGALNNKPTAAADQNKCTITSVSFKGNSGSVVTNDTDVTVTWALGSSSSGETCIAEGTMITLTDGSKKAVEDLRKGDVVMAFDHVTGEIVYRDVLIVGKTYAGSYYKNTFFFEDGTSLVTINEHGIYDLDLNQYVNIGHQNYREYVGHRFVSVDSSGDIGVKRLVDVATVCESGYKYDIVTNGTFNYVAEDTLSVTHEVVDIVNSFAFGDDMLYDAEAMKADLEKYGLYTYEDFAEYCDRSVFEQYNMAMMKIGVSKGYYTKEHLVYLLTEIALNEDVQIID